MMHMYAASWRRRQAGFSLVELGVALVVLGLLAMGAVAFMHTAGQQRAALAQTDLMTRAQQSVLGFVYAQHRLPCPAIDDAGVEACGTPTAPHQVGKLPWRSLQLPEGSAARLKYGVYRAAHANSWQNTDLAVAMDRFRPLITVGDVPAAAETLLGNVTAESTVSTAALGVRDSSQAGALHSPVAFAIVAPGQMDSDGTGDQFDALNRNASHTEPVFEAGTRVRSDTYDDRVLATSFQSVFAHFGCGEALSAIHHSHVNAATSAAVMRRAASDLHYQMQVNAVLAGAAVSSATAAVAMATAGVALAVSTLTTAIAISIISYATASALIASASFAVAANTAVSVLAVAKLALSIAVTVDAAQNVTGAENIRNASINLATQVDVNARTADALGY